MSKNKIRTSFSVVDLINSKREREHKKTARMSALAVAKGSDRHLLAGLETLDESREKHAARGKQVRNGTKLGWCDIRHLCNVGAPQTRSRQTRSRQQQEEEKDEGGGGGGGGGGGRGRLLLLPDDGGVVDRGGKCPRVDAREQENEGTWHDVQARARLTRRLSFKTDVSEAGDMTASPSPGSRQSGGGAGCEAAGRYADIVGSFASSGLGVFDRGQKGRLRRVADVPKHPSKADPIPRPRKSAVSAPLFPPISIAPLGSHEEAQRKNGPMALLEGAQGGRGWAADGAKKMRRNSMSVLEGVQGALVSFGGAQGRRGSMSVLEGVQEGRVSFGGAQGRRGSMSSLM